MDLHILETIAVATIKIVCYWFIIPLAVITLIVYVKKLNKN